MSTVDEVLKIIVKGGFVTANVLLALITSGTLQSFLELVANFLHVAMTSDVSLMTLFAFFVAAIQYWPKFIDALMNQPSVSMGSGMDSWGSAMRIFP